MENEFKDICRDLEKDFKFTRNHMLATIFVILAHGLIMFYVIYTALTNDIGLIYDILASAICTYCIMILGFSIKAVLKDFRMFRILKVTIKFSKTIKMNEEAENENSK